MYTNDNLIFNIDEENDVFEKKDNFIAAISGKVVERQRNQSIRYGSLPKTISENSNDEDLKFAPPVNSMANDQFALENKDNRESKK